MHARLLILAALVAWGAVVAAPREACAVPVPPGRFSPDEYSVNDPWVPDRPRGGNIAITARPTGLPDATVAREPASGPGTSRASATHRVADRRSFWIQRALRILGTWMWGGGWVR